MDLLNSTAKHCSLPECNDLDFLPFTCDKCQKIFCKLHRQYANHKCFYREEAVNVLPTCPLCLQKISVGAKENPDEVMDIHIRSGCKTSVLSDKKKDPRCGYPKCKKPQFIQCKKCHFKFCPGHRFPDQHNCPGHPLAQAQSLSSSFASMFSRTDKKEKPTKAKKRKPRKINPMVERMKLKTTAKGNKKVPYQDRFYAMVEFSQQTLKKPSVSMFFNKNSVGGQVLDEICTRCRIHYNPYKRKLRIVCVRTGGELPMNIALHLLEPEVTSGDSLKVEYEDEAEVKED